MASDGKVHVVGDVSLQHWVGTSAGWTKTAAVGEVPSAWPSGLAFLPTGAPVVLVTRTTDIQVGALRDGRWTFQSVVEAVGDEVFAQAAFAIDTHGRMAIAYSGSSETGDQRQWLRAKIACPPL